MGNNIGWDDVALRLLCTVVAGALIGINRGEHGRAAGLRTTLLVCLAASVSMIQVNLLLTLRGKASDSYVVMDLMRLPLGILSGMGFIGAGAILRKDNLVMGVTTAATLWFTTVLGLCFGGGQIGLGWAGLALGLIVLAALKPLEKSWKQERHASLIVVAGNNGPSEQEITTTVLAAGYRVSSVAVVYEGGSALREIHYQVKWRGKVETAQTPAFVTALANRGSALKIAWQPELR